jgi:hypothetical protein
VRPPPSLRVQTFASNLAVRAQESGFLASGVSLNLSLLDDEPAFAGLSLRRKFPFPAHGGDRFDDWVVGPLSPTNSTTQSPGWGPCKNSRQSDEMKALGALAKDFGIKSIGPEGVTYADAN